MIGVRKTWLYRGTVLKNLERWEIEAHDFLRALCNQERWREEILRVIQEQLISLQNDLSLCERPSDVAIGIVNFISALTEDYNINLHENLVWTRVKLNDSTIESGTIKCLTGTDIVVYSEEDDSVVTESQKKIDHLLLYIDTDLMKNLSQDQVIALINQFSVLIPLLDLK